MTGKARKKYDPTVEDLPEEPAEFAEFIAGIPDDGLRRIAKRLGQLQAQAWAMYAELKPRLLAVENAIATRIDAAQISAKTAVDGVDALQARVADLERRMDAYDLADELSGPDAAG